jgi:hypothetical protein
MAESTRVTVVSAVLRCEKRLWKLQLECARGGRVLGNQRAREGKERKASRGIGRTGQQKFRADRLVVLASVTVTEGTIVLQLVCGMRLRKKWRTE